VSEAASSLWIASRRELFERLDRRAAGGREIVHVDPLRRASAPSLRALERLDAACLGERGLASPRWMRFDAAYLPGMGIAIAAPLPIAFAVVVPAREEGVWLVDPMGTLDEGAAPLESLIRLAGGLLHPARLMGVAAWQSPALAAWAALAPVRLRAAWAPFRGGAASCVVELASRPEGATGPCPAIESGRAERVALSEARLRGVQSDIEAGERLWLLSGPRAGVAESTVGVLWEGWEVRP
jgi:hypothetical protein